MKIRFTHPIPRLIGARHYEKDAQADLHPAFGWRMIRKGVAEPVDEADIEQWRRERAASAPRPPASPAIPPESSTPPQ